jgi:hypothetical protein
MKNIVSKEIIGIIFKNKGSLDKVIVYGILNYAFCMDSITHSEATKEWVKEHGDNFLIIRFKSIIDGGDKSMPLESFFEHYDLLTQKFDDTKWIN